VTGNENSGASYSSAKMFIITLKFQWFIERVTVRLFF